MSDDLAGLIERDGFAVVESVIDAAAVERLATAIAAALGDAAGSRRGGYGMRHLLRDVPDVRQLAGSPPMGDIVRPILGPGATAVRGLFFDKTPRANWAVGWHQDLQIAVRERREAEGFGPWSVRDGVTHVQPPASVLERMLAIRVHLDDCTAANGALRVIPGSHRQGRLDDAAVHAWMERDVAVTCEVNRGGALLMRPLLLHASSPATSPSARRVIHLEYACGSLPGGLCWAVA